MGIGTNDMSTKQNDETQSRWYMVNKDGMATLCADQADAEKEAADAQAAWPHLGPHRAVQLEAAPLMGAAGDAGTVASCDYKSMFGAAVSTIATISEALGIDEEEAACANGAELILEAIQRKNEALLAALQKFPVDSKFSPPSSAKGVAHG